MDLLAISGLALWLGNKTVITGDRRWFRFPGYFLKVYMRHTRRLIDGEITETVDVASVEVNKQYRSRGHFTAWLNEVQIIADDLKLVVYIESVLEPRLVHFLEKKNYQRVKASLPPCYYRNPLLK